MNPTPERLVSCADSNQVIEDFVTARMAYIQNQLAGIPVKFTFHGEMRVTPPKRPSDPKQDRGIAEAYGVPPWLVRPEYDTRRNRLWWRLRHVRRAWRWLRRRVA